MTRALKVSEASSLAMHAMGLLASQPDQSLSVKMIAARFKVSEAHLSKVMQRLVKVGLATSARGPKGGFTLAKSPERLTLLEVFEAIEGPFVATHCLFAAPLCDGSSCLLGKVMVDVNHLLHDRLSTTTLDKLGEFFRAENLDHAPEEPPGADRE